MTSPQNPRAPLNGNDGEVLGINVNMGWCCGCVNPFRGPDFTDILGSEMVDAS
jgi:hypothetical protein